MIDLTVIGGYLGSGKTTLLNEILSGAGDERVAVIVNDFGTINIDAELVDTGDGRTWEVTNGCICCDLADGMAAAVDSVRAARPSVARVFVEVSGVGQPDVVARWGDHPGFSRGGSVVCVDVTSIRRDVGRKWVGDSVLAQLRGADRLLLTKTDLIESEQIDEVTEWLENLPGVGAEVVDREQVLARTTGFSPDGEGASPTVVSSPAVTPTLEVPAAASGHVADDDVKEHSTWSITTSTPVDPDELHGLIVDLPEAFVRAKGIVADRRRPGRRILIQFDGTRFVADDFASPGAEKSDEENLGGRTSHGDESCLVLIAAGADDGISEAATALAHALHGRVVN